LRFIVYGLLGLIVAIQYPLWIGKGGWLHVYQLDKEVQAQKSKNEELEKHNNKIAGDVNDLRDGTRAVEERARIEHGMVKENETMIQIVQSDEQLPKAISKNKTEKKDDSIKDVPSKDSASKEATKAKSKPKDQAIEKSTTTDKSASTEKVAQ
jgi:cell division protein FtsB